PITRLQVDTEEQKTRIWNAGQDRLKGFNFQLANGIINSRSDMSLKQLEQARKKDHIFTITDMAIKKVKLIAIPGFSNEQNLALQQVHKDLLKIAKEENDCKEVMLLQNYDFEFSIKILGTENSVKYSDILKLMYLSINHMQGI
ncbi:MAG: hypothetical protein ACI3ZR_02610, partial [bacterium]